METSNDRIKELAEEYPWLESLKGSFKNLNVPIPKEKFLEAISKTSWRESTKHQPPSTKPEEILQYLLQLNIVETRLDERINMPEIYLYGFNVKRRGGVKRPK
jgi:hypothetical protein